MSDSCKEHESLDSLKEVKQQSYDSKPKSIKQKISASVQQFKDERAAAKTMNENYTLFANTFKDMLIGLEKICKVHKADDLTISNIQSARRKISLCSAEKCFDRGHRMILAMRDIILSKDESKLSELDYETILQNDPEFNLIADIMECIKSMFNKQTEEEKTSHWNKALLLLNTTAKILTNKKSIA